MPRKKKTKKEIQFQLWKFPALPRKLVFQLMDVGQLLNLSMISRPAKRFLSSCKTHRAQLTWEFHQYRPVARRTVGLTFSKPTGTYMVLTLKFKVFNEGKEEKEKIEFFFVENNRIRNKCVRTVNGVKAPMMSRQKYYPKNFVVTGRKRAINDGEDMKFMENLTKHFSDMFYVTYKLKHCNIQNFDLFGSFIWREFRSFKKVKIFHDDVSEENLRIIINDFVADDIFLYIDTNFTTINGLNLRSRKLKISECNWLSINKLLESENENIEVKFSEKMIVDELVKVVTLWRSGEKLRTMKTLELEQWLGRKNEKDKTLFFRKAKKLGMRRDERNKEKHYVDRVTDGAVAELSFDGNNFRMSLQENNNLA